MAVFSSQRVRRFPAAAAPAFEAADGIVGGV
jgi:hypothetical protein